MGKEHLYKTFEELDKAASLGGGMARIEKQHEAGRMTARERIDKMCIRDRYSCYAHKVPGKNRKPGSPVRHASNFVQFRCV